MPSVSGLLQRKKYFIILDKDEEHPRKPFFDVVCFELIKDNPFYHEIRYIDSPFFTGLVQFEKDNEKNHLIPFKFWKRKLKASKDQQLKVLDPTDFRHFILNSQFVIVGNHLNKPQGHQLEQSQIVETDTHEIQKIQMDDYLQDLQPVYDYLDVLQYKEIRNFLFCHSCKQQKKYTLIDETSRYKSQAFYVCRNCAGREIVETLRQRDGNAEITPTLKSYLRDLLKKYKDANKVLNIFNPNFNILEHPEATLVGVRKKKVKFHNITPHSVFDFEIPELLRQYYIGKGRTQLLPAQIMALEHGLMENQTELIVSSTSSGKTMIGEITGFSKILEDKINILTKQNIINPFSQIDASNLFRENSKELKFTPEQQEFVKKLLKTPTNKKMLYLVPIVALANMRFREYRELEKYGLTVLLKVGVSHISQKGSDNKKGRQLGNSDIIVATYEAIDIILRSGHPHLLKNVGTIIVDEIQMLADEERGFVLDGLIARLRLYLPRAQMLYLSATISDPVDLADHLRASLIHYDDRPVPIERHLVMCIDDTAKLKDLKLLVREEFKNVSSHGFRGQSIIFTNSRKNTERLAEYLNLNHIRADAYHGGLEQYQRKLVEKSFELQKTACVVTTAALAAGVDFPASQVIFYNLTMGIKTLTVAEFEQMSGRAGRLKKHDMGRVYLLVTPGKANSGLQAETEERIAVDLLKGKIEPLKLIPNEDAQFNEVLAFISMFTSFKAKTGITREDLSYGHQMLYNGNFNLASALKFLESNQLVRRITNNSQYQATKFGQAVAQSFFSLKEAIMIKEALQTPVTEENPAPDMILLAMGLHKFNNVYVTNRMLAELSMKNQKQTRSNNLFSNSVVGLIGADNLGKKKGRVNRRLYEIILKWSENIFNCVCKESPYCDCGRKNVEGFIIDYRLSGLSIPEIRETLKDEFEIKVFFGDLIDYLEAIIYTLLSIQKIGRTIPVPAQTMMKIHNIPKIVNLLIGPRKTN